jgi:transcriptional regulator with XRE-family HTH domain
MGSSIGLPRGNAYAPVAQCTARLVRGTARRRFFRELGARIAELRKARTLTQVQLAERLDVTQQQVASYEVGRRRVPVSLLAPLAEVLGVSLEELLGAPPKPKRRGPAPKLEKHFERIAQLPRARQKFVLEVLDSVLQAGGQS